VMPPTGSNSVGNSIIEVEKDSQMNDTHPSNNEYLPRLNTFCLNFYFALVILR